MDGHQLLLQLAGKYVWWQPPERTLAHRRRFVAQVMNIGDFNDATTLLAIVGRPSFEDALKHAEVGWFTPKAWAYWHYRFELTPYSQRPPKMPSRQLGQ